MSAGTIKVTNGSAAVTGTGTTFTTELKQGDVVYTVINGTPYNLIVGQVTSDTALTLVDKHTGPTGTALAWSALAASMQQRITQLVAAKLSLALQQSTDSLNNLQMLLTQTGDVTITALNGQQFTGASWQKITKLVNDADLTRFTALANAMNQQASQVNTWYTASQIAAQTATDKAAAALASQQAAKQSETNAGARAQEAAASAVASKSSQDAAKVSEMNAAQYDSTKSVVNRGPIGDSDNINTFGASRRGTWLKTVRTGSTVANGFPTDSAVGVLEVFDGGFNGLTQRWLAFSGDGSDALPRSRTYVRCLTGAWNGSGPWGPWMRSTFETSLNVLENDSKIRLVNPGNNKSAALEFVTADRSVSTANMSLTPDGKGVIWNYAGQMAQVNFNQLQIRDASHIYVNGNVEAKEVWGTGSVVARVTPDPNAGIGAWLSAPQVRSMFWGRGGNSDQRGAYFAMYHQEYVGSYARGILNVNGYGRDYNWFFMNDGSFSGPSGIIQGAASDVRLKDEIVPSTPGAGDRIDSLGTVEYTEISTGKKRRGFISQQAAQVDPLYVDYGGENVDIHGDKFDILNVMDRSLLADLVDALQEARADIRTLKEKVATLEAK